MLTFLQDMKFIWRVQSVGETETDLKYTIAPGLVATCQDPTSTARTLSNIILFLNSPYDGAVPPTSGTAL